MNANWGEKKIQSCTRYKKKGCILSIDNALFLLFFFLHHLLFFSHKLEERKVLITHLKHSLKKKKEREFDMFLITKTIQLKAIFGFHIHSIDLVQRITAIVKYLNSTPLKLHK